MSDTRNESVRRMLDELLDAHSRDTDARARRLATDVLDDDPANRRALRAMAILSYRAGDYAEAERRFEGLVKSGAPDADLLCYLGLTLQRQDRLPAAIERFEEALSVQPGYPLAVRKLSQLSPDRMTAAMMVSDRRLPLATDIATPADSRNGDQAPVSLAKLLESEPGQLDMSIFPGPRRAHGRRSLWSFTTRLLGAVALVVFGVASILNGGVARPLGVLSLGVAACLLGYAVLGSHTYRYTRYDYRIDVEQGVLFRRHQVVWFYKLLEIEFVQTPLLSLVGTARLDISADGSPVRMSPLGMFVPHMFTGHQRVIRLVGIGSPDEMSQLANVLRVEAVLQRRRLKLNFV